MPPQGAFPARRELGREFFADRPRSGDSNPVLCNCCNRLRQIPCAAWAGIWAKPAGNVFIETENRLNLAVNPPPSTDVPLHDSAPLPLPFNSSSSASSCGAASCAAARVRLSSSSLARASSSAMPAGQPLRLLQRSTARRWCVSKNGRYRTPPAEVDSPAPQRNGRAAPATWVEPTCSTSSLAASGRAEHLQGRAARHAMVLKQHG
jgi:hypothetical protein